MAVNLMCKCGATLTVTADMAGKMGACPKCGKVMRIPQEAAAVVPKPAPKARKPAREKHAPAQAGTPAPKAEPPSAPPEAPARSAGIAEPPIKAAAASAPAKEPGPPQEQAIEAAPEIAALGAEQPAQAPLYPVNIRWPRKTRVGAIVIAGVSLLALAAAIIFATTYIPKILKEREEKKIALTAENKSEEYVNAKYGYRVIIYAEWMKAEDSADDKLVLRGRSGASEISFEAKPATELINQFLGALAANAAKEDGFQKEEPWSAPRELAVAGSKVGYQFVYSYDSGGTRWRAMVRTFRFRDKWIVVTLRAPLADYQRAENQFKDVYFSFAPE